MRQINASQKNALQSYYDDFQIWPDKEKTSDERIQRQKKLQSLLSSEEKIDSLSKHQVDEIENSLWATQTRFQRPISILNDLDKIKKSWKYLLYGHGNPFERADKVNNEEKYKLENFAESKISELLSKVRPDQEIALLNSRIKNLVERLGFKLTYGKSYGEKLQAYDDFVKQIQKLFNLKNLDETDFFIFFIDYYPNYFKDKKEPLPRFKKGEFSFVEEDFKSTTGEKEDAQYLHKRFKLLHNILKESLGEEYDDYKSYVSRPNKQPLRGEHEVRWDKNAWLGFVSSRAVNKRPQESIQFQITLTKEYVSSDIWVSFVAKEKIKELQNTIKSNRQQFIQILKDLPADYVIGAYLRGEKPGIEYSLSEITEEKIDNLLEVLSKNKSEFSIGTSWDKDEALQKGTEILPDMMDSFEKLQTAYNFINGFKVKPVAVNGMSIATNDQKFLRYEKLLEKKKQIIFFGPPGTGKTFNARNFADFVIRDNIKNKIGDEPTSGKKEDWKKYLEKKLTEISPSGYKVDNPREEYFTIKSQNDEKRIRVFYGNKEKTNDSVEIGFKESSTEWIKKVPKDDRFFILINLSKASYVVLPYSTVIKKAQFRGGENWDETGHESMWFTMTTIKEDEAVLSSIENIQGHRYNCNRFLFNLESIFVSDIEYITFHPSYSYEEFVEGIKARTNEKNNLEHYYDDGIFKRICNRAANDPKNKFVVVIDELNRGNLAKIFGELITIIENDKREEFPVRLAYSKQRFTVPKNIFLIGTMNTADRSLVQIDIALRRRFGFEEFLPMPELLTKPIEEISLSQLLENLNKLILKHSGNREYQIGHSYFMSNGKQLTSIDELKFVFESDIIPLLQEYFYEDYSVLKDVLGENFVDVDNQRIRSISSTQFKEAIKPILEYGKQKAPEEPV